MANAFLRDWNNNNNKKAALRGAWETQAVRALSLQATLTEPNYSAEAHTP